jgi:DNA-binding MarR family transcriptional regulator
MTVDVREVAHCTCLALRRAARQVTQLYDRSLEQAGLTANQFGLLGQLYGASAAGRPALSIGALAERVGTDPTTLNRGLKPLEAQGLVATATDPDDRRVRTLSITRKGRTTFEQAVPLWRAARAELQGAIGAETMAALTGLLDRSSAKMLKRA